MQIGRWTKKVDYLVGACQTVTSCWTDVIQSSLQLNWIPESHATTTCWLLVLGRLSYFYNQEIQKRCNILYTFSGYFKNFGGLLVVFIKFLWDVFFSIFTRRCRVSENSSWSSSFVGVELFLNFSHILVTFWLIGEFYVGFVF